MKQYKTLKEISFTNDEKELLTSIINRLSHNSIFCDTNTFNGFTINHVNKLLTSKKLESLNQTGKDLVKSIKSKLIE